MPASVARLARRQAMPQSPRRNASAAATASDSASADTEGCHALLLSTAQQSLLVCSPFRNPALMVRHFVLLCRWQWTTFPTLTHYGTSAEGGIAGATAAGRSVRCPSMDGDTAPLSACLPFIAPAMLHPLFERRKQKVKAESDEERGHQANAQVT